MHENKMQRKHRDPGLLFELCLKMCQNTHFLDTKCLKFYNKNVSPLSNIFLFL